ncbi:enoyl-CoA hydratase-related protein [Aestuariibacter sp. AA17]|uniref:Enoyl-CoA hydratase-related protein n=1 Tax=Fluctibacter corallii TaxID=2984329 RepID=A0ABT3A9Q5_9ALTE|nr:enoyl-CoA hydratase-related protein [Aestuariibacter sp. AA17]MCV2885379.1 enoyl-CoA hydratase-related protein [Aestuariibacter sp. AA17]
MSEITVNDTQHVREITLNRPKKRNALTQPMYQALANAIESVKDTPDVSVILIKSEGEFFCAGNDLHDFARAAQESHISENVRFMHALMECDIPVVACIQGNAIGIGVTMLLHCDIVVAAANASFALPFVELGLVPEFSSSYLLPRMAGHRIASKYLLLGEPFTAEEAMNVGIISHVAFENDVESITQAIVTKLSQSPRSAVVHTKALLKANQREVALHMNDELDVFVSHLQSPAAQEAVAALLEKRPVNKEIYR